MDNNKIGKFWQQQRLAKGMSQAQVAARFGYTSPQFVSNWERGVVTPPLHVIGPLRKLLDVPAKDVEIVMVAAYREEIRRALQ